MNKNDFNVILFNSNIIDFWDLIVPEKDNFLDYGDNYLKGEMCLKAREILSEDITGILIRDEITIDDYIDYTNYGWVDEPISVKEYTHTVRSFLEEIRRSCSLFGIKYKNYNVLIQPYYNYALIDKDFIDKTLILDLS